MTSSNHLESILKEIKDARVLIVGDMMLDTYLSGAALRISPEAPVPVVKLDSRTDCLGGAANCAKNISALGGVPIMMGAIGRKEAGERFMNIVHEHDFDESGILLHDYFLTTRKIRVVAEGQQIVRVDEEEELKMSGSFHRKAIAFVEQIIPTVKAVAVSDYAKGFVTGELMTVIHDLSKLHNIPVLVDPKPVNAGLYKGCDLLKPNCKEAVELSGVDIVDDKTCETAALKIMYEYSPHGLLITRGSDGMNLFREDCEPVRIDAYISHVYDVSGAGDTVLATLAMAYAAGADPVDACMLAAASAAVAVRKPGTSTVSTSEILDIVRSG